MNLALKTRVSAIALDDIDYAGRDLRYANFEGVKLHQPNFARSSCRGANFRQAQLRHASCQHADFAGADFTTAQLEDCSFLAADLRGACFRQARLRRVIFTDAVGQKTKRSALLEGANFYQCALPFDLLKFGILHRCQTPYDHVGVLTPAVAARFATVANNATERAAGTSDSFALPSLGLDEIASTWREVKVALLDTITHVEQFPEYYGPDWRQKQRQVKRLEEEVSGSEEALVGREATLAPNFWLDHPRQWLPVLALPGMEVSEGIRGNSLLAQAFHVLAERKRWLPYGPQERKRLTLPCPEVDRKKEFCDAENRLKELYVERWLNWLENHPEKATLVPTLLSLCRSQDSKTAQSERVYTARALAERFPKIVP